MAAATYTELRSRLDRIASKLNEAAGTDGVELTFIHDNLFSFAHDERSQVEKMVEHVLAASNSSVDSIETDDEIELTVAFVRLSLES